MRLFGKEKEIPAAHHESAHATEKDVEADQIERKAEVGGVQAHIDPEMEKRVRRKIDWHVIPLVSALYLFAFLDRSNIG